MRFISFILLSCVVLSCKNNTSGDAEPAKSLSDSLLQQVIDGHDVAMPKMMKLERLEKEAQSELDSLKKQSATKNAARIAILDSTVKSLNYADVAMHEWMEGFKYDSLKGNEPARIDYLKIQLESVNKMKEVVLSSIKQADSVLAQ
jgi:hypothetical protein